MSWGLPSSQQKAPPHPPLAAVAKVRECSICFEQIGAVNSAVTACNHPFCFQCLGLAITHHNACPICRAIRQFLFVGRIWRAMA